MIKDKSRFVKLLKAVDCLIDTVERTTDLDNVYNDKTGESLTWAEVYNLREQLSLWEITYGKKNSDKRSD